MAEYEIAVVFCGYSNIHTFRRSISQKDWVWLLAWWNERQKRLNPDDN